MTARRRNHYDVTNKVRISSPREVCGAVCGLLQALYPPVDLGPVEQAFDTFARLYAGKLPGYHACDTWYHDAQHSLDCALAMARLFDGYERSVADAERLGARRAVLGILIALFHDAGYIRRHDDRAANGAEYTLSHVRRSGDFLAEFLPTVGFQAEANLARRVVHFTGYEVALDDIRVGNRKDRLLGFMLGSADVMAQTADRCYLEKCRDFLFLEFSLCGIAGSHQGAAYTSAEHLLSGTLDFNQKLWSERLDGYFEGIHRYLDAHFGRPNPYAESIRGNLKQIGTLARRKQFGELRRRPVAISGPQLREILGRTARKAAPARRETLRNAA